MSGEIVLPLDLTGNASTNKITNEEHILNSTTGKCFALNYGGFYTASIKIRLNGSAQYLLPVTDYIVVAPYDEITRQSGKEAACAIVITRPVWEGTYIVEEYQAIGGEFGTNVEALREVLENFNQDLGSVHWNSIIDKPDGFDTAPHLIDFRKEVIGFEGLISSINEIADILGSPSAGQISAVQATLAAQLTETKNQLLNVIMALSTQINIVAGTVPDVSGLLAGTGATNAEVLTGPGTNTQYLRTANLTNIGKRTLKYTYSASFPVASLDTTDQPRTCGTFNLRANSKGDTTVPNSNMFWFIDTMIPSESVTTTVQVAVSSDGNIIVKRSKATTTWGLWTRIDTGALGTTAYTNLANNTTTNGGDLYWETPSSTNVPTVATTKNLLTSTISTGRAISTGDIGLLNTTNIPSLWINANLRPTGDASVPNASIMYYIVTRVNAHAATSGVQMAYGFSSGVGVILMRQKVSNAFNLWTRVDAGKLGDLSTWTAADPSISSHLEWDNVNLINNAFTSPRYVREAVKYNMDKIYPVGMISVWPGLTEALPSGFSTCQGQLFSRLSYAKLFNVIGTRYGNTTSSNFRVPDLRGKVVRGLDDRTVAQGGFDAGRDNLTTETAKLGSYQADAIQNIVGEMKLPITGRTGSNISGVFGNLGYESGNSWNMGSGSGEWYSRLIIPFDASRVVRTSTETRVRNLALHYVIKLSDI